MLFENTTGEEVQVMFVKGKVKYWKGVKPGEKCDIPENYGRNLGFTEVKALESKVGEKKVETKKFLRKRKRK